jgi:DNA-directed RNA polymerase I subunit RPA12
MRYVLIQHTDTSSKVVVTSSKPSAFPSALRTRLRSDLQEISEADMQTEATIRQPCEKCGNPEVLYHEQQLRSADEGSTIFYTCPRCNHKWNTNN